MSSPALDVLALAAHRDDVEQTCGGTLLKMAQAGQRTGILDLTRGEMGTRGSAEDRAREAAEAARLLRASFRDALDIPDGRVENSWENRLKIAKVIREQRPRVLIVPYWQGRHPDHYTASTLGYEAAFLAGLTKLGNTPGSSTGLLADAVAKLPPHRPFKIIYASSRRVCNHCWHIDRNTLIRTRAALFSLPKKRSAAAWKAWPASTAFLPA
jgi:bacillithiol biosynthesis deacetylase BshB1